jgi:hypothetical protein
VPGIGSIFSLVLLYEIHDSYQSPRILDLTSSGQVVKCAHEWQASAMGRRIMTSAMCTSSGFFQKPPSWFWSITRQGRNTVGA